MSRVSLSSLTRGVANDNPLLPLPTTRATGERGGW